MSDGMKKKILALFIIGVIAYFLLENIVQSWEQVHQHLVSIDILKLVVGMAIIVLYFFFQVWIWTRVLLTMGERLAFTDAVAVWSLSMMGRYLPGKVWLVIGRVYLAEKKGVSKRKNIISIYLELVMQMMAGAVIFVMSCYRWIPDELVSRLANLVYLFPLLFLGLHPWILEHVLNFALKLIGREPIRLNLTWGHMIKFQVWYALGWMIQGLGLYFMVSALFPLPWSFYPSLTGIFAVAWTIGLLAVIVPGGLGVREGILSYLLGFQLTLPLASLAALSLRLWLTLAELLFFLIALKFGVVPMMKQARSLSDSG